jgi:hypothetical protein
MKDPVVSSVEEKGTKEKKEEQAIQPALPFSLEPPFPFKRCSRVEVFEALPKKKTTGPSALRTFISSSTVFSRVMPLNELRVQLQSKSSNHLEDGPESWSPLPGKCLVQTFSGKVGIPDQPTHPLWPGNVTQRLGNNAASFFICGHLSALNGL